MNTTPPTPRPRKLRWLLYLAPLTVTAAVTGWIGPVGASPAHTKALLDLPVSASQRGPWTVAVNSLPPVTGTVSIAGTPTVNVANLPAATPAPLWQGTPVVWASYLNSDLCRPLGAIPAGTVLFVERAVATVNFPPGSVLGELALKVTPLGGGLTAFIPFPVEPGRPVSGAGGYDDFSGTLELGIPVSDIGACFDPGLSGAGYANVDLIGYLVPAP